MKRARGFSIVKNIFRRTNGDITLPTRGTSTSAGYDFYSPSSVKIPPGGNKVIWTDVKAYMNQGEVLMLYVRSSIGINRGLTLANGTGVIDADYFENIHNDGNIGICLHNNTDYYVSIDAGERIAQGVFINFLEADNINSDKIRSGGIGSTN